MASTLLGWRKLILSAQGIGAVHCAVHCAACTLHLRWKHMGLGTVKREERQRIATWGEASRVPSRLHASNSVSIACDGMGEGAAETLVFASFLKIYWGGHCWRAFVVAFGNDRDPLRTFVRTQHISCTTCVMRTDGGGCWWMGYIWCMSKWEIDC